VFALIVPTALGALETRLNLRPPEPEPEASLLGPPKERRR